MTSPCSQCKALSYLFEIPVHYQDTTHVLQFELNKYSFRPTRMCRTEKKEVMQHGAMSSRCVVITVHSEGLLSGGSLNSTLNGIAFVPTYWAAVHWTRFNT